MISYPLIMHFDGMSVLRAKSGDRYMIRVAIGGGKMIDLYFADPLHLEPVTAVDASPNEPNPPNFDLEYGV